MKSLFHISVLFVVFSISAVIPSVSNAAIVQIDPETSFAPTTGGVTGLGLGTLTISGSFQLETTLTTISFQNIDMTTDSTSVSFDGLYIPDYQCDYDGLSFLGPEIHENYIPIDIVGTFDGTTLHMEGHVLGNISHDFTINATVIPLPPTMPLLLAGTILIRSIKKEKT